MVTLCTLKDAIELFRTLGNGHKLKWRLKTLDALNALQGRPLWDGVRKNADITVTVSELKK